MDDLNLWVLAGAVTISVLTPLVTYLRSKQASEVTAIDVAADSVKALLEPLNERIDALQDEIKKLQIEVSGLNEQLKLERKEREWQARHNAALSAQLRDIGVDPISFAEIVNYAPSGEFGDGVD